MVTASVSHLDVDSLDQWDDESQLQTPAYRRNRGRMPVSSHNAARRASHRSKARSRPNHGRSGPNSICCRRHRN